MTNTMLPLIREEDKIRCVGGGAGGGVRIATASARLYNCTIVSNYAVGFGGGLYNTYAITMENCILYHNGSGTTYTNYYSTSVDASFSNCCFAPALGSAYTNNSANNITANPLFDEWTNSNYRLSKNSPCINAGVNRDWMASAVDLDGHRRIDVFSGIVDMGCFEHIPSGTMFKIVP